MDISRRALGACAAFAAVEASSFSEIWAKPRRPALGLQVHGRMLLLKERPYMGAGVNCFSLLILPNLRDTLAQIRASGIPFVRTNFGALLPGADSVASWKVYFSDKARFYGKRDELVAEAENLGIGLIPSMFWRMSTVPDAMLHRYGLRDARDQLGAADSRSRSFMRDFTHEFVNRYKGSPAVWGWEIGNEFSLEVFRAFNSDNWLYDHDGIPKRYVDQVKEGEATGSSDIVSYQALSDIYREWSGIVVDIDGPDRFRSSGAAIPLPRFWGSISGKSVQFDTYEQWMTVAPYNKPAPLVENPKPDFNVISVHMYQQANVPHTYFRDDPNNFDPPGLLELMKKISNADHRPLWLGEYGSRAGASGQDGTSGTDRTFAGERRYFSAMLDAIVVNEVQLSAIWNYGRIVPSHREIFDIQPGTDREYQLNAVAEANAQLQKRAQNLAF